MNKKKVIYLILIILIGISTIIFWKFRTIHIDKMIEGVQYNSDNSTYDSVKIEINGDYKMKLDGESWFSGTIKISSIDYTYNSDLCDVKFDKDEFEGSGYLIYESNENGTVKLKTLGRLWKDENFDTVCIKVEDKDINHGQNQFICAPATNRDVAKEVTSKYTE